MSRVRGQGAASDLGWRRLPVQGRRFLHHGQPVRGLQEEGIRGLITDELVQGLLLWRFVGELVQGLVFGIIDELVLLGRQRWVEFFQRLILGQLSR